jgi:hypothetical protein
MRHKQIIFREATPADKGKILHLFSQCFSNSIITEKSPDFWDWQMIHNPEGQAFVGLAEVGNNLVGSYSVIPLEYLNEAGDMIRVGLVVDVMTHPDYQRRGIFVSIGKYTLREAVKKLNLTFTIGYPCTKTTLNSVIPGHKKVGWALCDRLSLYMLPIKLEKIIAYKFPVLKTSAKLIAVPGSWFLAVKKKFNRALHGIKSPVENLEELGYRLGIQETLSFNRSDLTLFEAYSKNKFIKKRSMNFLRWRFQERPNSSYKIIRILNRDEESLALEIIAITLLKNLQLGLILDFFGSDDFCNEQLLIAGIQYLAQAGCDAIFMVDYETSDLSGVRDRAGFLDTRAYYQIINWKTEGETYSFPIKPRLNFVDYDLF